MAARWSRRKKELPNLKDNSHLKVVESYLRDGDFKKASAYHFSISLPKGQEVIGKVLSIGVIVFIMAFLLFAAYFLFSNN
jgi:hypothetical protein